MRLLSFTLPLAVVLSGCALQPASGPVSGPGPLPAPPAAATPGEETPQWWFHSGAAAAQARQADRHQARNIIIFIGDGMGVATVAAARILAGQQRGHPGEENLLAFEHFEHTALVKTYNTDQQTPDSAGTMSAMMGGIKTRAGIIGLDSTVRRGDCAGAHGTKVPSLLALAQRAGMATGIVTTTRITHATPAATYAHSADRNWEFDGQLGAAARAQGCVDIAAQLIESPTGAGFEVIMGGGRQMLLPAGSPDPEYPERRGLRRDGRNLIEEWRQRHPGGHWVWERTGFDALESAPAGPVLALFDPDHMKFEHDRDRDRGGEPSLAEMTRTALDRLADAPDGYVLMVEGGRIDHAHHFGNAFRALTDTIALSDAVAAAAERTDPAETLILVTADHSHVLSFAGYPRRGNPILGTVMRDSTRGGTRPALDAAGRPYTTLSYANGPGYAGASTSQPEGPKRFLHTPDTFADATGRPELAAVDTTDPDYLQEAMVPLESETHGGEDVVLYARGPGASAVRGVIEQNVLFHIAVQATPRLREHLCADGGCRHGVPDTLRRPGD